MARERLTTRVARQMESKPGTQVEDKGTGIDNDTAAMNNPEHEKNDPSLTEYQKGDPSAWAEDPNMKNPAKDDQKREETGHAPLIDKHAAAEAVASVRKLEEKAVRAIIASQRILPGADDDMIERQASLLMHLPDFALNGTLKNQEDLAKSVEAAAEETEGEEKEEKEAAKEEEKEVVKEEMKEEKEAAKEEKPEEEMKEEKEAAKKKDSGDEEEEEEKKEEAEEEEVKEEKEAATDDIDLLQSIFTDVTASESKKGASSLSGMVKKEASESKDSLAGIWGAPPDVSRHFQ